MSRPISPCCQAKARVNVRDGGYFCSKCGDDCKPKEAPAWLAQRTTLSVVRKPSGERELFVTLWAKCGGKSEVSGTKLLPPEHPQFHFQGCHLLPKGSYPKARLDPENIAMTTVDEHVEEWPFVKELSDEELRANGAHHWIPIVTRFRALRLKYNERLAGELAGVAQIEEA